MTGRYQQVAERGPIANGPCFDTDRELPFFAKNAGDRLPADPTHRNAPAIGCAHEIADIQILHGDFARRDANPCIGHETDMVVVVMVMMIVLLMVVMAEIAAKARTEPVLLALIAAYAEKAVAI